MPTKKKTTATPDAKLSRVEEATLRAFPKYLGPKRTKWREAPVHYHLGPSYGFGRIKSGTLLGLKRKGYLELRVAPGVSYWLTHSMAYTSWPYQWRRTSKKLVVQNSGQE